MYRLYISLVALMILSVQSEAVTDSTGMRKKYLYRVGADIAKPIQLITNNFAWMEFQAERINEKNGIMYLEFGGGSGTLDQSLLKYNTSGVFFRWGLAQNIVYRAGFHDVETASIGFRYGGAWCRNSEVHYTIEDPIYGSRSETQDPRSLYRHWIEVNIGMKFKMYGPLYIGWTLRGAYKINKPLGTRVDPIVIPGYGRGDRTSAVSANIYLSYLL